ncbi:hypothetical protein D3C81_1416560 [compost metagenome]
MRRAVVQNHVQVQLGGCAAVDLLQEGQELLGPVSLGDATDDLARQDVKGGIQTGRAVTLVVMRPPLDLPGLERQHGLGAIQRLDLRFLVNREHQRVVGRIQVQPDHIDHLVGKKRIVTDFECLQPVRLEVGSGPDLSNLPRADLRIFGHQANTPVCCLTRDTLSCC